MSKKSIQVVELSENSAVSFAKNVFIVGALLDGMIAISWFFIAYGIELPNILNGYIGIGDDYRLMMFISAMFMASWTVILVWGALNPRERKGIFLITAGFLILSVILEVTLYSHILSGLGFAFGLTKRLFISALMLLAYIKLRVAMTNQKRIERHSSDGLDGYDCC